MAALIGARLGSHLQKSLMVTDITYWSDSQIVLHWLKSSKPTKRFITNRVTEMSNLTSGSSWRYCPTDSNPADLLTRGITADKFLSSSLWSTGPSWLCNTSAWPTWGSTQALMQTTSEEQTTLDDNPDIPANQQTTSSQDISRHNQIQQIQQAPSCYGLRNRLSDEVTYVKSPTSRIPRPTLVNKLQLFPDGNGLLRCGGRIQNAPVAESTKFPYLLPKKHLLTRRIVLHAHEKYLHAGTNATVTNIRQKYWIPAIRQCVNAITRKCVTCRRVIGRPYSAPDPPPLPKIRVENAPPFTVTGADFTGAIQTKNNTGTTSKANICLFTCAATRAIHLEVVTDLLESTFMQAFRRFVSRKSLLKVMISDNATTYQSAATSLRELFQSASISTSLSEMGTEWRFIPKRAPWYGGFWERLIGLTKVTLKKIIGRAYVTLETLQTITKEAECMINNRPLTHVPSSPDDPRPLTPAHLLYGRQTTSLPYSNDIVM
ncbi:uncharacterized protein LOC128547529 [Mercenaria mercenaria]|uniref:uncharacterized protein LOC128547529 n=1 Tax=Mercenaria mercenaria TaxID=6596 RepID=UPI00234F6237|nr:uncharacterized protein LOC128547529 [Mercenaria mercenaria]